MTIAKKSPRAIAFENIWALIAALCFCRLFIQTLLQSVRRALSQLSWTQLINTWNPLKSLPRMWDAQNVRWGEKCTQLPIYYVYPNTKISILCSNSKNFESPLYFLILIKISTNFYSARSSSSNRFEKINRIKSDDDDDEKTKTIYALYNRQIPNELTSLTNFLQRLSCVWWWRRRRRWRQQWRLRHWLCCNCCLFGMCCAFRCLQRLACAIAATLTHSRANPTHCTRVPTWWKN